jgi:hypothetical protein
VVAAVLGALWAFVLLPPQLTAWSGHGAPGWSNALDALPVYDGVRLTLAAAGVDDLYAVFGAAASVSFVLIWWATGPTFARLGWNGRVLGWLVLCSAPITALSYLNHPTDAPFHALWGSEGFALLLTGLWAVFAGAAPRASGIPAWERVLVGSTLVVMVVATLGFGYWPHGTLIGFAAEAAVLAARAPRFARATAGASASFAA